MNTARTLGSGKLHCFATGRRSVAVQDREDAASTRGRNREQLTPPPARRSAKERRVCANVRSARRAAALQTTFFHKPLLSLAAVLLKAARAAEKCREACNKKSGAPFSAHCTSRPAAGRPFFPKLSLYFTVLL
jgi:hypothetical protein